MQEAASITSQAAAGDGSVRYFLFLDGRDGGATVKGFENAFEVSAAALDVSNPDGVKAAFGDLALTLKAGSGTDELVRALVTGQHIATARLVAARQNDKGAWVTVDDYRFEDAVLTGLGLGSGAQTSVTLGYRAIEQSVGGEPFGWNVGLGQPLGHAISPAVPGDEDAVSRFADVGWFLVIDGVDGGGRNGAFRIADFSFSMNMAGALGGGGSGKAAFTPLAVSLELGSAADEILDFVASGKHIVAAQLFGVDGGGKGRTVYDLRLADLIVSAAQAKGGASDTIDLQFGAFSLTTANTAGDEETVGFNLGTNTASSVALAEPNAIDEAALNGGTTDWRMVVDGLNGGGKADGLFGAFDIRDFAFGASNPPVIGPGGGGGAGKVTFDDISVTFAAGSALDELMELLATGRHMDRGIRLVGDTSAGGKLFEGAFDLRFNEAIVTGITTAGKGLVTVTFGYGLYSLTTTGSDGKVETAGWNLVENDKITTPVTAAVGSEESWGAWPGRGHRLLSRHRRARRRRGRQGPCALLRGQELRLRGQQFGRCPERRRRGRRQGGFRAADGRARSRLRRRPASRTLGQRRHIHGRAGRPERDAPRQPAGLRSQAGRSDHRRAAAGRARTRQYQLRLRPVLAHHARWQGGNGNLRLRPRNQYGAGRRDRGAQGNRPRCPQGRRHGLFPDHRRAGRRRDGQGPAGCLPDRRHHLRSRAWR